MWSFDVPQSMHSQTLISRTVCCFVSRCWNYRIRINSLSLEENLLIDELRGFSRRTVYTCSRKCTTHSELEFSWMVCECNTWRSLFTLAFKREPMPNEWQQREQIPVFTHFKRVHFYEQMSTLLYSRAPSSYILYSSFIFFLNKKIHFENETYSLDSTFQQ